MGAHDRALFDEAGAAEVVLHLIDLRHPPTERKTRSCMNG